MDDADMAMLIAAELRGGGWKTLGLDTGEAFIITETGHRFRISIIAVDDFDDDGIDDDELDGGDD